MSESEIENKLIVTSALSDLLINGVNDKTVERIGGALVVAGTRKVIALIRSDESGGANRLLSADAEGTSGQAGASFVRDIGASALDIGASGFGVLSLAVVTMEFGDLLKRVNEIERRLQQTQELLEHVNRKLDLGFYSNFYAALDLASRAFTMERVENRSDAAWQAVNRLTEARRHYVRLADYELRAGTSLANEYLATLLLAYAAEIRCYLEMGEPDEATKLLDAGIADIYPRVRHHIGTLLTSNPAAYLHPSLKHRVNLRRLSNVFRWLDPTLDDNSVFEQQRDNIFLLGRSPEGWIKTLPPAVWDPALDAQTQAVRAPKSLGHKLFDFSDWLKIPGRRGNSEQLIYERLAVTLETIEGMIEDMSRFQAYRAEIQAIKQLGISFSQWKRLPPPAASPGDTSGLLVVSSLEPLELTVGASAPQPRVV